MIPVAAIGLLTGARVRESILHGSFRLS